METSASIKEISAAMLNFQKAIGTIKKTSSNPFFKSKYAALPDILNAISKPLEDNGLLITQHPEGEDELCTMIIHPFSGEFMKSTAKMHPVKNDPQAIGSAITYQRRYALGAILNLDIDDDDDGNKASEPEAKVKPTANQTAIPEKAKFKISENAFDQLCDKLKTNPDPLDRGNLLAKTRRYYLPMTDDQENIISQITDSL